MVQSPVLAFILKAFVIIGIAYVAVVFLVWRFQNRLAFPGPDAPVPPPAAVGIPDGERVEVATADGVRLRGWYLPPQPPPSGKRGAPGLLWFYGNMETVRDLAPILRDFRPPGTAMLVLDYRGYGESDGTPTELGLYRDAEAAWDYLAGRPNIDSTRIAIYGRSLGSAVALYLATERPARAVILDSPFSNARQMADVHYAFVPKAVLNLQLDNVARAARLQVPLLVFHGSDDRVAPIRMGRAVAQAGRAEEFITLEGSGHNETYDVGGRAYVERVHQFLAAHLR